MKKITDIHELRSIQMGILDEVHRFCEAHGLRYFLSSGTLIGAVRHKGYIPWDDDIDIYMPREDYETFLNTYHDEKGIYRAINPASESHYYYTFAKVVDQRTHMVERETEGYEIGVYMDIFPVDFVTEDLKERERIFRQKKLLYKIRRCKISSTNPLQSTLAYLVYKCWPMSVRQIERRIRKLIVLEKPTRTVCNMTEAGPSIKGCFPAEDERTYGDYMTLPPEDQRVTHKFEAYWK